MKINLSSLNPTISPDSYLNQLSNQIFRNLNSNSSFLNLFSSSSSSLQFNQVDLNLNPHHLYYLLLKFDLNQLHHIHLDLLNSIQDVKVKPYHPTLSSSSQIIQPDLSDTNSLFSSLSISPFKNGWNSNLSNFQFPIVKNILNLPQLFFSNSNSTSPNLNTPHDQLIFIYSTFTKLPSLSLSPSSNPSNAIQSHCKSFNQTPMQLIEGFTDLPNQRLVPLTCFKSLWSLYLYSLDPRMFSGWLQLSQNLRRLEIRKSGLEDLEDLLINVILDEIQRDLKRQTDQIHLAAEQLTHQPLTRSILTSTDHPSTKYHNDPSPDSLPPGFPNLSWAFLQHLCLSDNSLTFLPTRPLQTLVSLVSLDLSCNLFISIPTGLHNLPCLKLLNISDNMIDSILGIHHTLPSTIAINLSRNRLVSLCGIDELKSLERLDIRANQILDISEISRLATLPKLNSLWVSENPFCSLNQNQHYSDWRIEIFNYFSIENREIDRLPCSPSPASEVPTINLKLDNQAPTLSERKAIQKPSRNSEITEPFISTDIEYKKTLVKTAERRIVRDRPSNKRTRDQPSKPSSNSNSQQGHETLDPVPSSSCSNNNKNKKKYSDKTVQQRRKQPRIIEFNIPQVEVTGGYGWDQAPSVKDDITLECEAQEEVACPSTLSENMVNEEGKERVAAEVVKSPVSITRTTSPTSPAVMKSPHPSDASNRLPPSFLNRPQLGHLGSPSTPSNHRSNSMDSSNSSNQVSLRNRIEALKSELGDDAWLRVLSETEFGPP